METVKGINEFTQARDGCVLTIGVFDGLHLGHRAVISKARQLADKRKRELVLLTFAPGPTEFFTGTDEGFYLMTLDEFQADLASLGVDRLLLLPFDKQLRGVGAEDFLLGFVRHRLDARALVVGEDFSFGRDKMGNIEMVKEMGAKLGLELITIGEVLVDGVPVRSTRLREMIRDGRIKEANLLLGYAFYVMGRVGHGQGVGDSLKCPTANIEWPHSKVKPRRGVYVVRATVDGRGYKAVADFGIRPTITRGDVEDRLEVHLLDFKGNLEGKEMKVEFLHFLRDEVAFTSKQELADQIVKDISDARGLFAAGKF